MDEFPSNTVQLNSRKLPNKSWPVFCRLWTRSRISNLKRMKKPDLLMMTQTLGDLSNTINHPNWVNPAFNKALLAYLGDQGDLDRAKRPVQARVQWFGEYGLDKIPSTQFEGRNAKTALLRWFWGTVMVNVYSSESEDCYNTCIVM